MDKLAFIELNTWRPISLPPFNLIRVTYLGGSAPVAADFNFFLFWGGQLVDILDWKFKIFIFFFSNNRRVPTFKTLRMSEKRNVKILNFQPKTSTSDQKQEKVNKLGGEQKLNPKVSHTT